MKKLTNREDILILRDILGLTNEEFAAFCEISIHTLYAILSHKRKVGASVCASVQTAMKKIESQDLDKLIRTVKSVRNEVLSY